LQRDHLVIVESEDCLTLRIDDWELFDFIDDHLTDHDLEHDYHTEERVGGVSWYVMHFHSDIDATRLREVLELIDSEEIERIWRINN